LVDNIGYMINPNVLLQLGRERHRDLLNEAYQSRRRFLAAEPAPADSDDVIVDGRFARVIDARVRTQTRVDRRGAA
jgi:hypothetical protein